MTDNEIINALECCLLSNEQQNERCGECPMHETPLTICQNLLAYHALVLISRQKAEIERLQKENNLFADIGKMYSEIKAEAYKEFAERLKAMSEYGTINISPWQVDNLVKEMAGEQE